MLKLTNDFLEEVVEKQKTDARLLKYRTLIEQGKKLTSRLMSKEGHRSNLSIHPGVTKMYQDLKNMFWWPGMKKEIAEFVYAWLTCQKSKVEHQKPSGLLQPMFVPEWKWDS
ncbi:hypothetical protein A2U01_0053726, partial [Trifolium medium]|nr:hypothetical protein [Trifolium medium]